jgi:hypothetical protein
MQPTSDIRIPGKEPRNWLGLAPFNELNSSSSELRKPLATQAFNEIARSLHAKMNLAPT